MDVRILAGKRVGEHIDGLRGGDYFSGAEWVGRGGRGDCGRGRHDGGDGL